jgi:hypothetical protein
MSGILSNTKLTHQQILCLASKYQSLQTKLDTMLQQNGSIQVVTRLKPNLEDDFDRKLKVTLKKTVNSRL